MGGFMQPQGHVQVVVGLLDDGAAPQAVLDRPRFCIEPVDGAVRVSLETGLPAATAAELRARGHDIVADVGGYERSLFGRGQLIVREPDGRLTGASDPRADGEVRGT
jgi:gamma-glutamyltranspeptidase/glutathione hydrolase